MGQNVIGGNVGISSAEEIIEDIRQGKMVVLVDDEDRENEGDILVAADKITPDIINFMATHGRGLICLTLTQERCLQLNLPQMVKNNTETYGTAFTVSIEAAEGVDTGISAKDRCRTIQAAVAADATPNDIVTPGHIFPVMAQDGGVLVRAGHTEAGCDVAALAGLSPAGVIVEVLNEDGTMARRPDLEKFCDLHGLKLGTIADLIAYRYANEKYVTKTGETSFPTHYGDFKLVTFEDSISKQTHYALVKGEFSKESPTLVRVHKQEFMTDVLQSAEKLWTVPKALERISEEGGVILILGGQESQDSIDLKIDKMMGKESAQPQKKVPFPSSEIGIGSQILSDLGIGKIRLLTSSHLPYHSLSGFGLEVVEYINSEK